MRKEKAKKTEVITFRTSPEIKNSLEIEADEKQWTVSQLVEQIISRHVNGYKNNTIINVDIQKNHTINIERG